MSAEFVNAFVSACKEKGLTDAQISQSVKQACAQFPELREDFEKFGGFSSWLSDYLSEIGSFSTPHMGAIRATLNQFVPKTTRTGQAVHGFFGGGNLPGYGFVGAGLNAAAGNTGFGKTTGKLIDGAKGNSPIPGLGGIAGAIANTAMPETPPNAPSIKSSSVFRKLAEEFSLFNPIGGTEVPLSGSTKSRVEQAAKQPWKPGRATLLSTKLGLGTAAAALASLYGIGAYSLHNRLSKSTKLKQDSSDKTITEKAARDRLNSAFYKLAVPVALGATAARSIPLLARFGAGAGRLLTRAAGLFGKSPSNWVARNTAWLSRPARTAARTNMRADRMVNDLMGKGYLPDQARTIANYAADNGLRNPDIAEQLRNATGTGMSRAEIFNHWNNSRLASQPPTSPGIFSRVADTTATAGNLAMVPLIGASLLPGGHDTSSNAPILSAPQLAQQQHGTAGQTSAVAGHAAGGQPSDIFRSLADSLFSHTPTNSQAGVGHSMLNAGGAGFSSPMFKRSDADTFYPMVHMPQSNLPVAPSGNLAARPGAPNGPRIRIDFPDTSSGSVRRQLPGGAAAAATAGAATAAKIPLWVRALSGIGTGAALYQLGRSVFKNQAGPVAPAPETTTTQTTPTSPMPTQPPGNTLDILKKHWSSLEPSHKAMTIAGLTAAGLGLANQVRPGESSTGLNALLGLGGLGAATYGFTGGHPVDAISNLMGGGSSAGAGSGSAQQLTARPQSGAAARFFGADGKPDMLSIIRAPDSELRTAIASLSPSQRAQYRQQLAAFQPTAFQRMGASAGGIDIEAQRQRLAGLLA